MQRKLGAPAVCKSEADQEFFVDSNCVLMPVFFLFRLSSNADHMGFRGNREEGGKQEGDVQT